MISLEGGQKDNAITREAVAELLIDGDQTKAVKAYAAKVQEGLREEYEGSDARITIQITEGDVETAMVLYPTSREKVLFYLMEVPVRHPEDERKHGGAGRDFYQYRYCQTL